MSETITAAHSWREFIADSPYRSSLACQEASRDDLWFGTKVLRERVASSADVGGLLMWNKTEDPERGALLMLTGQDVAQEHRVMDNAKWLVSCGAVYAASRVGTRFKGTADHSFTHEGDKWICWLLWNDREVASLRGHNEYLAELSAR